MSSKRSYVSTSGKCLAAAVIASGIFACANGDWTRSAEAVDVDAGGGNGGATSSDSGGAGAPPVPNDSPVLPARIRRLTDAEFDLSVKQLLGIDSSFGKSFTPDTRQDGFTVNDGQRVDPVFALQVDDAAQQLAAKAVATLDQLAPCADKMAGGEACARTFLQTFAARAYRRRATSREIDALVTVYQSGADGATYADGMQAVLQAVLESPGFLYVTEIGEVPLSPMVTLTPYETANAISYLLTGGPPDSALTAAAASGSLSTASARQDQARRLLALPAAATVIDRIVEEWLGIDRIDDTAKDSNVYPAFAGLKDAMTQEADDFVSEILWKGKGTVGDLLSADWTIAGDDLARMYLGLGSSDPVPRTNNRVSLTSMPRRGILDQGAFLSVYSHADESGPVLRGVAMMRRVACLFLPSPTSLNINVIPPAPDPTKTTRERFAVHATDKVCAGCHKDIDGFGFSFENFDAMGRQRTEDSSHPIDSSTVLSVGSDYDGAYPDSSPLLVKMAKSPSVLDCFARHVFHSAGARSDSSVSGVEQAFVDRSAGLPSAAQGNLQEMLVAWVASDSFTQRRSDP